MKGEEMMRVGMALGLAMGGKGQGLIKIIEDFKKEMKELGVEVKISVSIDIPRGNVNG